MKPSENCFNLIKKFEGCKLLAYLDSRGRPTIGWGSTRYFDLTQCPAVQMGDRIDQDRADLLLKIAVDKVAAGVTRLTKKLLTQNQFDALVSFSYNTGITAFGTSLLLKLLNEGQYAFAEEEILKWDHEGDHVNLGLLRRREAEANLFGTD